MSFEIRSENLNPVLRCGVETVVSESKRNFLNAAYTEEHYGDCGNQYRRHVKVAPSRYQCETCGAERTWGWR